MKIHYGHGQMVASALRALYWHGVAVTGVAKMRQTYKVVDGKEVPLSDEEKTAQALNTMKRHIEIFQEACDTFLPGVDEVSEETKLWAITAQ